MTLKKGQTYKDFGNTNYWFYESKVSNETAADDWFVRMKNHILMAAACDFKFCDNSDDGKLPVTGYAGCAGLKDKAILMKLYDYLFNFDFKDGTYPNLDDKKSNLFTITVANHISKMKISTQDKCYLALAFGFYAQLALDEVSSMDLDAAKHD